ncbi:hypothetical protein VE23_24785 [Paenibacillus sp. D9]|uniref:hypothetical protein n=1 Tax=Paenibacillus sp. D9 TaxID=665792 RepID=UPI00061F2F31|nr:hypothetical protein [Paenibacillus sp. D9]KKC49522.1 hypothetical protein VE23_24785 [Paenibacillus sp. D9]
MGMKWPDPAPTEKELDMIEQVAILEMMPARYEEAYEQLDARRNILNRLYGYCVGGMSLWTRKRLADTRKELGVLSIHVQRPRAERGVIIVPYRCRSITGSLTLEKEDAERKIRALIAEYGDSLKELLADK